MGPSIASGSQTWSGNWALLPTAPQKMSRAIAICQSWGTLPNFAKTACMLSVPSWVQMAMMPEREAHVADAVDQEGLLGRHGRGPARIPEADQQVAAQPDQLPAGEDEQEVVGHDQEEHREHEQVQVGEEAPPPRVVGHVADRVDMDEHADRRDDDEQACRQRVYEQAHAGVEAARDVGRDPGPERDAGASRPERRGVEQGHDGHDRSHDPGRHHRPDGDAVDVVGVAAAQQAGQDEAAERQDRDERKERGHRRLTGSWSRIRRRAASSCSGRSR